MSDCTNDPKTDARTGPEATDARNREWPDDPEAMIMRIPEFLALPATVTTEAW